MFEHFSEKQEKATAGCKFRLSENILLDVGNNKLNALGFYMIIELQLQYASPVTIFNNWFMLSVRTLSYECTREVWRAREKRSALQTSQVQLKA